MPETDGVLPVPRHNAGHRRLPSRGTDNRHGETGHRGKVGDVGGLIPHGQDLEKVQCRRSDERQLRPDSLPQTVLRARRRLGRRRLVGRRQLGLSGRLDQASSLLQVVEKHADMKRVAPSHAQRSNEVRAGRSAGRRLDESIHGGRGRGQSPGRGARRSVPSTTPTSSGPAKAGKPPPQRGEGPGMQPPGSREP
jgi:hypothetical protein